MAQQAQVFLEKFENEFLELSKNELESIRKKITQIIDYKYLRPRKRKRGNLSPYISMKKFDKILEAEQNPKFRLCYELMRSLALRIGEVVSIKLKDIDFNNMKMFVHTEKADLLDVCYFTREIAGKLSDYIHANYSQIKAHEGYVFFPNPLKGSKRLFISQDCLRKYFRLCCNLSSIQYVYGKADHQERILNLYSSHSCRHSGITDFYLKTKDIILTQKYARHKSIKSTMQYIHTTEKQLKEAIQSSEIRHDPEEFKEFLVVYEEFKKRKNVGVPPYSCYQSTV